MNYKYTYESPLGTMVMLGTLSYLTDLFFIDESKERLNLYISCDKKNIFLKNSSININYK